MRAKKSPVTPVFSFLQTSNLGVATVAFDFSEPRATRSFPILAKEVPAPAPAPQARIAQPMRVPVSRHVVDLKAITAQRVAAEQLRREQSRPIVERAFASVVSQQQEFIKSANRHVTTGRTAMQAVTKTLRATPRMTLPSLAPLRSAISDTLSAMRTAIPTVPAFSLPPRWKESLAVFALVAFVFTIPFQGFSYLESAGATKGAVLGVTASALDHLRGTQEALSARDLYSASKELSAASERFATAISEYRTIDDALLVLAQRAPVVGEQLDSAEAFVTAAQRVTARGATLAELVGRTPSEAETPTQHWAPVITELDGLAQDLTAANDAAQRLRPEALPADYADALRALRMLLPEVADSARELRALGGYMLAAAGADRPQRYLILFQNNNELRATGGFIGSYAFVELNKGVVSKMEVPGGGSYDLQGGLTSWVKSPKPLRAIEDRWQFHDANWFFDFPTSARTLSWFYEHSGGTTVDGIIAVNATVLEQLIRLTGPITLAEYGKTFTEQNVIAQLQQAVEFEYDRTENKPKQIIADLLPVVLDRLIAVHDFSAAASALVRLLAAHDIQIYHTDAELESFVTRRGWSGSIAGGTNDYLALVSTNIAGGKTDSVMEQSASVDVSIGDDGVVTNTLTVTKRHTDVSGDKLTGITNVDYLRVYVPAGSTLVSAEGFNPPKEESLAIDDTEVPLEEYPDLQAQRDATTVDAASGTEVYPESGKTVFANWIHTKPGETRTVRITYRLPFTITLPRPTTGDLLAALSHGNEDGVAAYALYVQKQSGKRPFPITIGIQAPADFATVWSYPKSDSTVALEHDLLIGRIFTR